MFWKRILELVPFSTESPDTDDGAINIQRTELMGVSEDED